MKTIYFQLKKETHSFLSTIAALLYPLYPHFLVVTKRKPDWNSLTSSTLIPQRLCISLFASFSHFSQRLQPFHPTLVVHYQRAPLWETSSLKVSSLCLQWKCRLCSRILLTWETSQITIDLLSLPFYSGGGVCALILQYYFHVHSFFPKNHHFEILSSYYIPYCHHDLYIPGRHHGPCILCCCHGLYSLVSMVCGWNNYR